MLTARTLGVVVPTRNSAATLEWTMLSLASQHGVRLRIVVVDSESSDRTIAICRQWRIQTLSAPPGNMYRAINEGLHALADAQWLTYLNSDDLVYVDGYARLMERGERDALDVVYGNGDFMDDRGAFMFSQSSFGPAVARRQLAVGTMPFVQPAAIFRRDVFDRLGGFDERFRMIADYDFFARASAAGFRFGRVGGHAIAAFRVHDRQISTVQRSAVDDEKAIRRRECGRYRQFARMGLSALWKARNTANYLTRLARD